MMKLFWAKTGLFQSVMTHGLVSGCVCGHLMRNYLAPGTRALVAELLGISEEALIAFVSYLVSLHDIGKIEYHFQCKDPQMEKQLREMGIGKSTVGREYVRHEKTGASAISRIWERQEQDEDARDVFFSLIEAHHQTDYGKGARSKEPLFAEGRRKLEEMMRSRFLPAPDWMLSEIPDGEGVFEAVLLGMMILSPHAYLQDACFTVFIDTTPEWQMRIVRALENPKWCMYLGRKN